MKGSSSDSKTLLETKGTPEGRWILGGGIEIPCIYYFYWTKFHKNIALKNLSNVKEI